MFGASFVIAAGGASWTQPSGCRRKRRLHASEFLRQGGLSEVYSSSRQLAACVFGNIGRTVTRA